MDFTGFTSKTEYCELVYILEFMNAVMYIYSFDQCIQPGCFRLTHRIFARRWLPDIFKNTVKTTVMVTGSRHSKARCLGNFQDPINPGPLRMFATYVA